MTRPSFALRWCALPLCAALVASAAAPQQARLRGREDQWTGCSRGLHYRFVRYEASRWEVEAVNEEPCDQLTGGSEARVSAWLKSVREHNAKGKPGNATVLGSAATLVREERRLSAYDDSIFSTLIFREVCAGGGSSKFVAVPIEPLVGHLRHPHAVCPKFARHQVGMLDTSYLLINAWPPRLLMANFPGRKYLFDMGSSTFNTSLAFLTQRYEQGGVFFDEIWAWEMEAYDQQEYWAQVPEKYKGRMHFYNTAFSADIGEDASHPLNIMRSLFKPGDMFVVKLDIDNVPLELNFLAAIEADPSLLQMIAEMFFEGHYDHADMEVSFGLKNGRTLADVRRRFAALRRAGLSLHYWP